MVITVESQRSPTPVLLAIAAVFSLGDVSMTLLMQVAGVSLPGLLSHALDLGREGSIPTWYSSLQLLAAALLIGVIAQRKRATRDPNWVAWVSLAVGFCFLSLDETAAIHEQWGQLARGVVPRRGVFHFRWVVVALALLPVLGLVFWRLLRSLPPRTRRDFLASGAVFVGSAVGLEMAGGVLADGGGAGNSAYNLLNVAENGGELVGIAFFIGALVRYIRAEVPEPASVLAGARSLGVELGAAR